jgi:hypothetical protein
MEILCSSTHHDQINEVLMFDEGATPIAQCLCRRPEQQQE